MFSSCAISIRERHEGTLDERLAIVEQTNVGGFVLEIDGDGAVVPVRGAVLLICHPQVIESRTLMRHDEGNTWKSHDNLEGLRALPLKSTE
jgi:hypothetical protein